MKYIISTCLMLIVVQALQAQQLVGYEYFYNEDPGVGQGTYVAITPGASYEADINLTTIGLANGLQSFGIRFKDSDNNWSTVQSQFFINLATGNGKTDKITALEVSFDEDPGVGSGIIVPVTATDHLNQTVNVPIPNNMASGAKVTYVRAQNSAGLWSQYQTGITQLTVSINEHKDLQTQGISFFPNPASNYFTINMDNGLEGKIDVLFIDMSGRIVMQEQLTKTGVLHQHKVDCSKFSAGTYTMRFLHQQNIHIGAAKIIINK